MKVVVTGATGHLGRYTVDRLARGGHEVVAISRSGALPELPFEQVAGDRRIQPYAADLADEACVAGLASALEGSGALVHLAAWHPEQTANTGTGERRRLLEVNVHGTMRVLEAARRCGVKSVVYASSFEVYGSGGTALTTERARLNPLSDYGASKLAGEDHLFAFAYEAKARGVALRMPAVYGPGEKTPRALPNFLAAVARGELPTILGDGADLRDQLHVADAAGALQLAMEREVSGIFNISDGQPHSILELAEAALAVAGLEGVPVRQPRAKVHRDFHMSIDKAREELGFVPSVSLRSGMAEQLRWLRATRDAGQSR